LAVGLARGRITNPQKLALLLKQGGERAEQLRPVMRLDSSTLALLAIAIVVIVQQIACAFDLTCH